MKPVREQREQRYEQSKLRAYLDQVFLPNLRRDKASKSHIERHAAAVEYIERFVKRPLSPDEIDDQLVLNFDAWLWRQAISDGRRRDLVESIKRIVAAYMPAPERFTKRCQRRPLPEPAEGTLRHFYETVYIPLRLVGRTARYADENRAVFLRLYQHYARDILLADMTDHLAADHFQWLLDQGLRPATINSGHQAVWFAVWRHAHRLGLVDKLPTVPALPIETEEPDAWSVQEIQRLLDNCDAATPRKIKGIHAGNWWRALIHVAYYTGLRRRALLSILRMDVELGSGWLRVPAASMKNRRGQSFRLGLDALQAIAKIWLPERRLLFPSQAFHTTFYDQFRRIREAAGLAPSKCNTGCLHKLRRSSATEAARQNGIGAAQTLLGHSSPAMTRRYIDPTKMPGADFTKVLPPLGRRGPIDTAAHASNDVAVPAAAAG
jgi:integrase